MSWFYRQVVRPLLFSQDSESIHHRTLDALARASRMPLLRRATQSVYGNQRLTVRLWGLDFPNPVGLAAGMDKQAAAVPMWEALGFGFTEVGGVTWHPQEGNPLPRMFRAVPEEALINRMGFNNPGAEAMAARLRQWRAEGQWPAHPVGVNLGKSKITPIEKAADDYGDSFRVLWPHADFFVVNVSSPNTPNLRQLQDKSALEEILEVLRKLNRRLAAEAGATPKPVLVKVAPDLSFEALDEILALARPCELAGIVATNTTLARPASAAGSSSHKIFAQTGGLSGRPLRARSTEVVRHIYKSTWGRLPIIGVGGIFNAQDAWEKITAGASLVQVYSGLVYEGPGIARGIVQGLAERLKQEGFASLQEAVGSRS